MINVEAIPADLKARPQWVTWRIEERNGKLTKPPYSARTGGPASHANPSTWVPFAEAMSFCQRNDGIDGIGFVFTKSDEYAGVDIDKCRNPETGELTRDAQIIIAHLDSYTEVSPNGTGVHVIVCGSLPGGGMKRNGVEVYDRLRYFTVTGQHLEGTPPTIEKRYAELAELYDAYKPPAEPERERVAPQHVDVDDIELLEKIRQSKRGDRFVMLFDRGDWSGYESQSNADMALCSDLAFWTNRDEARVDALFRSSALMRPKWDERHYGDGRTYGQATIQAVVGSMADGYTPAGPSGTIIIDESEYRAWQAAQEPRAGATETTEAEYVCPVDAGSFIAEYVSYARERTDAPAEAHELMAVGILSALAGPGPRLRITTHINGWPLVIWTLYVVDSTVGRKSTVLNFAVDVVQDILTPGALIPWEGSPQGIIQKLAERDGRAAVFTRDEYSGLMAQMRSGGHMAGLEQIFIRAYDGGVIENLRTKKKTNKKDPDGYPVYEKDIDRVDNPYLVKLCASTRTALVERCTIDDVISGFLPRFVIVSGKAIPKPMKADVDGNMAAWREVIVSQARAFHEKAQRIESIPISPEVMDAQWALEQAWVATAGDMARPDAAAPSLKRLSETVLKVAALIAIDESRGGPVRVESRHFDQAYRLGERWVMSTMGLIDDLGSTTFMRELDAYRETIYAHPGILKSALLRKFRKVRQRESEEIINTLLQREECEIREIKGKGRTATAFYPFGLAPDSEGKEGKSGK